MIGGLKSGRYAICAGGSQPWRYAYPASERVGGGLYIRSSPHELDQW